MISAITIIAFTSIMIRMVLGSSPLFWYFGPLGGFRPGSLVDVIRLPLGIVGGKEASEKAVVCSYIL